MDIQAVINWILNNPRKYPGCHLLPQPRSLPSLKPLEPSSQLHIIWKATVEFIHEKQLQGRGVNIKGFGAFTFDIETDLPRTANIIPGHGNIQQQREERKHLHRNRPVFVPDPQLQYFLRRYHGKEQISKPSSQRSIYQKGFQMIFCNPVPIAQACYLDKKVVTDAHNALWSAVRDLAKLGHTITLPFNFAAIVIRELALQITYNPTFLRSVNQVNYETRMRKSDDPCATFWRTSSQEKWRSSVLSTLYNKPDSGEVQSMNDRTLALKIMSLDLSSTVSRPKTVL